MKQRLQGMVIGILTTVLLLGTVTAFAADTRTIEATFGNFRTYLFDQEFTVRNTQGEVLQPFMYNGSLYLPAEAILHAMGDNASWDAAVGIFRFGSVDAPPARERVPLQTAAPFFDSGRTGSHDNADFGDVQTPNPRYPGVQMGGVTYYNAIIYRSSRSRHTPNWLALVDNGVFTLHNLNGQYRIFSGSIGRLDGSSMHNATVEIRGDGRLLETLHLNAADMPRQFSLSVEGVAQLRVDVIFPRRIDHRTQYALVGYLQ